MRMIRFILLSFFVPLLVVGCLGASASRSDTKAVKHKEKTGKRITWPVAVPESRNPVVMPMAKYEEWKNVSDSNTKDKSSSVGVSGMLLPAIGIGLLLISAGLFFLNRQTAGMVKRVSGGVATLWDKANNMLNYNAPESKEFADAQKFKSWVETVAAEHNIKI